MSLAIVQKGDSAATPTTNHKVVMGSAPTSGNLLVAFYVSFSASINNSHINTGSWTIQQGHVTGSGDSMYILTRVADGTETTTLPNFQDGTVNTYFAAIVYEVSGSPTIDQTHLYNSSGGTLTTTSNNALCLAGNIVDGSGSTGFSSPWTQDIHASNVSGSGYAVCAANQVISSSGGSATLGASNPSNGGASQNGLVLLNPSNASYSDSVTESVTLADSSAATVATTASDSEAMTLSDTVAAAESGATAEAESMSLTDTVAAVVATSAADTEAMALTDSVDASLTLAFIQVVVVVTGGS